MLIKYLSRVDGIFYTFTDLLPQLARQEDMIMHELTEDTTVGLKSVEVLG